MAVPSVSFQGIRVDVSSFEGLQFNFQDGNLVLEMEDFCGKIILTPDGQKPDSSTANGPLKVKEKQTNSEASKNKSNSQSAVSRKNANKKDKLKNEKQQDVFPVFNKKTGSIANSASAPKETLSTNRKAPSKKIGTAGTGKAQIESKPPKKNASAEASTTGGRKASKNTQQKSQKVPKVAPEKRKRDSTPSMDEDLSSARPKSPEPRKKTEAKTIGGSRKTPSKESTNQKTPKSSSKKKAKQAQQSTPSPAPVISDELKTEIAEEYYKGLKLEQDWMSGGKKGQKPERLGYEKLARKYGIKSKTSVQRYLHAYMADKAVEEKEPNEEKNPTKKVRHSGPSLASSKTNAKIQASATNKKKTPAKHETKPKKAPKAKDKAPPASPKMKRSKSLPVTSLQHTKVTSSPSSTSKPKRSLRNSNASAMEIEALLEIERPKARTCQLPSAMGAAPNGRWAHSLTAISSSKLVLYGGEPDEDYSDYSFGDLHIYDLETSTWIRPVNGDGQPRQWHTATFLPDKNLLVVFGGEIVSESGKPQTLNDIMVLDTDICLWYPPSIAGKTPEPRAGHTASLVGKHLLIFGGSTGRKWMNSVACMDTERWTWQNQISIGGITPRGRSYHSATVVGKKIVIYGGSNYKTCFDELCVLDMTEDNKWEWFYPLTVGDVKPGKRTGHSATLLADQKTILFFGGWDPVTGGEHDVIYFKDSFLLDTELWEWLPGPEITSGHGVSNNHEIGEAEENILRYRTGHSAILVSTDSSSEIVLFGGQSQDGTRHSDLRLVTL